jgi:hypothetical protein
MKTIVRLTLFLVFLVVWDRECSPSTLIFGRQVGFRSFPGGNVHHEAWTLPSAWGGCARDQVIRSRVRIGAVAMACCGTS